MKPLLARHTARSSQREDNSLLTCRKGFRDALVIRRSYPGRSVDRPSVNAVISLVQTSAFANGTAELRCRPAYILLVVN